MYIEPNTNIFILKNVPLDNTYKNTIYFESKANQRDYFMGLRKHSLVNYSYQRVNKGVARVGIKAELLYDCNYLMFQNESFGDKWFYAFINKVEYVNNVVSEIYFEIDVMQTWFFDYTLKESFVEREHSENDNIGENIVPESLELGEYHFANYGTIDDEYNTPCVAITICDVKTDLIDGSFSEGHVIEKMYHGCKLYVYELSQYTKINAKLSEYIEKPNAIVSVYMIPKALVSPNEIGENGWTPNINDTANPNRYEFAKASTNDMFGSYKPKNHKLYTYPYNYLHIDNGGGSSMALRYEFFKDLKPSVKIEGTLMQPIKTVLTPTNYKGNVNEMTPVTLNTESLVIEGYPMCTWNNDTFTSWLAQNCVPMAISGITALAGIAAGNYVTGLTSNAYMAKGMYRIGAKENLAKIEGTNDANNVMSTVSGVGGALTSAYQASIAADTCKGSANSGNVNWCNGRQQFFKARAHISEQYARCIDEYFTMYGYQTNRVKIPNTHSRDYWNYVKTIGCNIVGKMPSDDIKLICSIYDNGITFWKNGSQVGNYSLDNSLDYDVTPGVQ